MATPEPPVPLAVAERRRPVQVRFAGATAGRAALTWAQRQVWDWIRTDFADGRHGHLDATRVVPLPAGTLPAQVLATVGELLVRHEALRTRFELDAAGQPEQVVAADGEQPVLVVETTADRAATVAGDLAAEFLGHSVDLLGEPALRVGVVLADGQARHAVLVVSRMAVDNGGAGNLRRDFNQVLEAIRRGGGVPDPPDGRQPLAQARHERCAAGLAGSEAALRHWREQLTGGAQLSVPFLDNGAAGADRIQRVVLRSTAVARALAVLTRRHRVQASAVVLAGVAASLNAYTGLDASTFMLHCGNRIRTELRPVVGNLKQHTLVTVATAHASFADLVERAANALLRGYRHGQYDSLALERLIGEVRHARGIDVARSAGFNDLAFGTEKRSGDVPSPAQIRAALAETVVERQPLPKVRSHADFVFYLHELGDRVRFSAHVDTGHLPAPAAEAVFRGVERLLVAAAVRDGEPFDWVAELDITPARRDADWVLVDHSWIHLPTTRRLALDVVAGHPFGVFVLPGPATRLGLYVAAPDRTLTPQALHDAWVARLPGVRAAMAPHTYTVCAAHPPAASASLDSWRRQPVLAAGTGRERAARSVVSPASVSPASSAAG